LPGGKAPEETGFSDVTIVPLVLGQGPTFLSSKAERLK
jgi:hypothetical protein